MNRGYSREHYLTLVDSIREHIPQVDLTTDVMVGFPGETEADFEQTLSLFEQVRYSTAFMFAFSARPGTKAATMSGQVPREVALARLASLIELQTAITRDHYQSAVGSERTVLFTMRQSKGERLWMGQDAGAYKVVCPSADDLTGALLKVRIIASSGMTLVAERID
jgi:tRNA-2-methylthio-N6-dimethylallyladenosine synthase